MSVETRPTDVVTKENLLIGMPIVEFSPTVGGVAQPFIPLGIMDSAELAKELDAIALEDSSSGTRVTVTELITRIDPAFNVGIFNFAANVLQFTLGSTSLTPVTAELGAW